MAEYLSELETILDGELVDALDDSVGQKMKVNQEERARYAKRN